MRISNVHKKGGQWAWLCLVNELLSLYKCTTVNPLHAQHRRHRSCCPFCVWPCETKGPSTKPPSKLWGSDLGIYREAVKGFLIKFTQDRSGSLSSRRSLGAHTYYIGWERERERERVLLQLVTLVSYVEAAFCYPSVCRLVFRFVFYSLRASGEWGVRGKKASVCPAAVKGYARKVPSG